jgi:hypothetical protein
MKLEFIKDSVELKEFEKTLKWEDQDNVEGDFDDYYTFDAIYYQESSGKYYSVNMVRCGGTDRYSAYRRNFKNSEPLVVNFHEVKPVEVVRIEWEMCEEINDWQVDVMIEMAKDSDKLESENFLEKVNNIPWPKPLDPPTTTAEAEARQRKFEDNIRYIQG